MEETSADSDAEVIATAAIVAVAAHTQLVPIPCIDPAFRCSHTFDMRCYPSEPGHPPCQSEVNERWSRLTSGLCGGTTTGTGPLHVTTVTYTHCIQYRRNIIGLRSAGKIDGR